MKKSNGSVSPASHDQLSALIEVAGGSHRMGSDLYYPEEAPQRTVSLPPFWIESTAVTNGQFRHFVESSEYVTQAEIALDPALYPNLAPEDLAPGSLVFVPPGGPVQSPEVNWWQFVAGASWRSPLGPGSSISHLDSHPVVQVSYTDAMAYADWAGRCLPTEAQWEAAARGGSQSEFPWGEDRDRGRKIMANYWRGEFPWRRHGGLDKPLTMPIGSFPPNAFGLFDMIGNVWEWTSDWYEECHTKHSCCTDIRNPAKTGSPDPKDPTRTPRRTIKGGSHLCAENYCQRYRPAARMAQAIDSGTSHIGFRCVVSS